LTHSPSSVFERVGVGVELYGFEFSGGTVDLAIGASAFPVGPENGAVPDERVFESGPRGRSCLRVEHAETGCDHGHVLAKRVAQVGVHAGRDAVPFAEPPELAPGDGLRVGL
jgi:hypothetical protein